MSFGVHYFPIKELLKTLFSHWRRSIDSYGKGLDVSRWAKAFVGNMISRVLGAFIRLVIIVVGIVFEIAIFFIGSVIILILDFFYRLFIIFWIFRWYWAFIGTLTYVL